MKVGAGADKEVGAGVDTVGAGINTQVGAGVDTEEMLSDHFSIVVQKSEGGVEAGKLTLTLLFSPV